MSERSQDERQQIRVSPETYDALFRLKTARGKQLGINLSWNEYFQIELKEKKEALK